MSLSTVRVVYGLRSWKMSLAITSGHRSLRGVVVGLRTAIMCVVSGRAPGDVSARRFEVAHVLYRQDRSTMMLGAGMMSLVDRDSGVDNFGGDGFLVHDRLDGLMDVMVNTFSLDGRCGSRSVFGFMHSLSVAELRSLFLDFTLG